MRVWTRNHLGAHKALSPSPRRRYSPRLLSFPILVIQLDPSPTYNHHFKYITFTFRPFGRCFFQTPVYDLLPPQEHDNKNVSRPFVSSTLGYCNAPHVGVVGLTSFKWIASIIVLFIQSGFTIPPHIHPFIHTFKHRRRCQPCKATCQLIGSSLGSVRVLLRDMSTLS